ncbi:hypothetical protein VDGL01_08700 [Verticillium dahliae]
MGFSVSRLETNEASRDDALAALSRSLATVPVLQIKPALRSDGDHPQAKSADGFDAPISSSAAAASKAIRSGQHS